MSQAERAPQHLAAKYRRLHEPMHVEEKGKHELSLLIDQLRSILEQKGLLTISNLDQFIAQFADAFPQYQSDINSKFDPEMIAQGYVSCSTAAMLVGLWATHHGYYAYYISEAFTDRMNSLPHVTVGLSHRNITPQQVAVIYSALAAGASSQTMAFVDYTMSRYLKKITPSPNREPDSVYNNLESFMDSRVKLVPRVVANQKKALESQPAVYDDIAETLYTLYRQLLKELDLLDSPDVTVFLEVFKEHFTVFQAEPSAKLSVDAFKRGEISCTGASILLAIWWYEKTGVQPILVLETGGPYFLGHFSVMLPQSELSLSQAIKQWELHQSGTAVADLICVEFKDVDKFNVLPPGHISFSPPIFFNSTKQAIANRRQVIAEYYITKAQQNKVLAQYLEE